MENTSNENIAEALKLLEEAAKQKKDELKTVISGKYTNLKDLIMENERSIMKSLTSAKDTALEAAAEAKAAGIEKAREVAREVDKNVHQNPWPFITGAAVGGLLLGFILGRSRK
jgi:ElaB/YqjD/DUF883 family membrane-anchored ribosome-binding protein